MENSLKSEMLSSFDELLRITMVYLLYNVSPCCNKFPFSSQWSHLGRITNKVGATYWLDPCSHVHEASSDLL